MVKDKTIQLQVNRGSFDALKDLLRQHSHMVSTFEMTHNGRVKCEALRRVFDQIRDVEYDALKERYR